MYEEEEEAEEEEEDGFDFDFDFDTVSISAVGFPTLGKGFSTQWRQCGNE